MAFIGSHNRFNEFREDLIKDTGVKNIEDNIELYIQYVTARFADQNHRLLSSLVNEIQDLYKVLKKVWGIIWVQVGKSPGLEDCSSSPADRDIVTWIIFIQNKFLKPFHLSLSYNPTFIKCSVMGIDQYQFFPILNPVPVDHKTSVWIEELCRKTEISGKGISCWWFRDKSRIDGNTKSNKYIVIDWEEQGRVHEITRIIRSAHGPLEEEFSKEKALHRWLDS
jgi:hypothetical protein